MLAAVLIAGTAAGIEAAPSLRWITPVFAGLLLVSAGRTAATPLVSPRVRVADLPDEVARPLLSTLAELPPGTARELLADLTRMGNTLYSRLQHSGDSRNTAAVLSELLLASGSAASDLAQLDAIAVHGRQAGGGHVLERHVARGGVRADQRHDILHHRVRVDALELHVAPLKQRTQPVDDVARPTVVAQDVGDDGFQFLLDHTDTTF